MKATNHGKNVLLAVQALIWITVLISSAAGASRTPEDTSYLVRETVRPYPRRAAVHTFLPTLLTSRKGNLSFHVIKVQLFILWPFFGREYMTYRDRGPSSGRSSTARQTLCQMLLCCHRRATSSLRSVVYPSDSLPVPTESPGRVCISYRKIRLCNTCAKPARTYTRPPSTSAFSELSPSKLAASQETKEQDLKRLTVLFNLSVFLPVSMPLFI